MTPREAAEVSFMLANGYQDLDLNTRFIRHKAATYLYTNDDVGLDGLRVGDLLIVDRSIKPFEGALVVATLDGQYGVRRLVKHQAAWALMKDDYSQESFAVPDGEHAIAGVAVNLIRSLM